MSRLRKLFHILLLAGALIITLPQPAQAQQAWADRNPRCVASGDVATIQGLECVVANVLNVAVILIGLIGFVMMLMGAFKYLLSGNNTKSTETARQTILYAIIGLVVALAAFIIVNLVAAFTGLGGDLLRFRIPGSGDSYPLEAAPAPGE